MLLNKDGTPNELVQYIGQDLDSSSKLELDMAIKAANKLALTSPDGWMVHTNERTN